MLLRRTRTVFFVFFVFFVCSQRHPDVCVPLTARLLLQLLVLRLQSQVPAECHAVRRHKGRVLRVRVRV